MELAGSSKEAPNHETGEELVARIYAYPLLNNIFWSSRYPEGAPKSTYSQLPSPLSCGGNAGDRPGL